MDISMTGIDFQKAGISNRELFSFTKSSAIQAVQKALVLSGADGCILLSTCNRTELWLSGSPALSPYLTLCRLKGIQPERYASLFVHRFSNQAIRHLFELSCGLKSQIFGEDQIITQVKQALFLSREAGCTGTVLEKLFQYAITASKRVKSEVFSSSIRPCTASSAISLLQEKKGNLSGLHCLVIGSGEIGKQTARLLLEDGCQVSITQRQFHSVPTEMPAGCNIIPYEDRYQELSRTPVVISATLSPHYTLKKEDALPFLQQSSYLFLDLAVPRDIDPGLAQLPGITCYNIDDLGFSPLKEQQERQRRHAFSILRPYEEEFTRWYAFRPYLPFVSAIGEEVAQDILTRLQPAFRRSSLSQAERETFQNAVQAAARKSVNKRLFSLRDCLNPAQLLSCFSALQGKPSPSTPIFSDPMGENKESVFPLFISLVGKPVVLFGGGAVSLRRTQTLLSFSCRITIISPKICAELKKLAQTDDIHWYPRSYQAGDCDGAYLVAACTNCRQVNHQIAEECYLKHIPVSVADEKEECTFFFPAVIQEEGVVLGISSQGTDHRLVSRVANRIRTLKSCIFRSEGGNCHEKDCQNRKP